MKPPGKNQFIFPACFAGGLGFNSLQQQFGELL